MRYTKRAYNKGGLEKLLASWEDLEMDVSDAESENLELYEGNASRGFFEVLRRWRKTAFKLRVI